MTQGAAFFTPIAKGTGAAGIPQIASLGGGFNGALDGAETGLSSALFSNILLNTPNLKGNEKSLKTDAKTDGTELLQNANKDEAQGQEQNEIAIATLLNPPQISKLPSSDNNAANALQIATQGSANANEQAGVISNAIKTNANLNEQIANDLKSTNGDASKAIDAIKEVKDIAPAPFDISNNKDSKLQKEALTKKDGDAAQALKAADSEQAIGQSAQPPNNENAKNLKSGSFFLPQQSDNVAFSSSVPINAGAQASTAASAANGQMSATHPASQALAIILQKSTDSGAPKQFVVHMDPPELGKVDVRVSFGKDKGVKALLTIEKPETFAMLQRDANLLERSLQGSGLDAKSGLEFSLANKGHDFNQNLGGGSGGERGGGSGYRGAENENSVIANGKVEQVWMASGSYSLVV